MCFNPELKAKLEAELVQIEATEQAELARLRETDGTAEDSGDLLSSLFKRQREIKREIADIPHRYTVGEGCHTGFNGDRYPYRVVSVSKSGKSMEVVAMGHKATEKAKEIGMGHQEWAVYDYEDADDRPRTTVTLRSNGRWATKGQSSTGGFSCFWPGACYSYNWHV